MFDAIQSPAIVAPLLVVLAKEMLGFLSAESIRISGVEVYSPHALYIDLTLYRSDGEVGYALRVKEEIQASSRPS